MELFLESAWATIAETEREQRKFDANFLTAAKQGNKSFIIKGRGSSVVEQPIRKPQQRLLNKRHSRKLNDLAAHHVPSLPIIPGLTTQKQRKLTNLLALFPVQHALGDRAAF
ncbi:MAG TPA: hypothetical protein VK829_02280 [Terriglobales bacterium]|nr:hypothetical protein [Terriglobales bacterium]